MANNKPDMIPIGVVDKFVEPIRENILGTTKAIEKLSENVNDLSDTMLNKLTDHDKGCDARTDELKTCYNAKNETNMRDYRLRVKEVDDRIAADHQLLLDLKKANDGFDEMAGRVESVLKDVQDKVKTMILVVSIGFLLFLAIYAVANFMVKNSIQTAVEGAVKEIIQTRGDINKPEVAAYWVDEKGVKRLIHIEPKGDAHAPQTLPTK